ncbi:MAG TPA: NAD-glutamate dehydrogenase [Devosiaceae bacterium]
MTETTDGKLERLLARAESLLSSEPGFANFMLLAVRATDPQDFAPYSIEAIEAILRRSAGRLGERKPGEHVIEFWHPEGFGAPRVDVIDIHAEDMPFIVDSVVGAIRAHGGRIRLIAHPILPVDTRTHPWTVLSEPPPGARLESFLQVHIAPLVDDEVREAMRAEIDAALTDVRRAVRGWRPMLERLRQIVQDYRETPPKVPAAVLAESLHFLAWLADHNFTFLGMREYRLTGSDSEARLEPVAESGLGILEDPAFLFLRHGDEYVEMTRQHVQFLRDSEPLMVTKANVRSRVHRRAHMDYIGVKLYAGQGTLTGELRIVGLFTSQSLATPHVEVPLVRRKISEVMRRAALDPASHAGKALMAALDNYPREELFQIAEDELLAFASIIANLPDRPRVRVLPRIDRFDNFVSVLVFVPRDRYTSSVRARIGDYLAGQYDGRVSAYYPHFPEGELVRVHFIIGRNGGATPRPDRDEIEAQVTALTRTFGDNLLSAAADPAAVADYAEAFSPAYETTSSIEEGLADIAVFQSLGNDTQIAARLTDRDRSDSALSLKVYHMRAPIPLSDRVPMLENFGFRVIDERTYRVNPMDGIERYLHDMLIVPNTGASIDFDRLRPTLESAMLAVWGGQAENDPYNQLTLRAGLPWDDVAILRALGRYLRQIRSRFSQHYFAATLATHADIAASLAGLFHVLHDPNFEGEREPTENALRQAIAAGLDRVASLDEDRIVRRFLNLIEASVRTNFYQRDESGARRPALAIKFDSARVDSLPEPRPYREIFVYSPRVEGVHLRGGPIARGGIRWSDRPEDFRTEVLGLVKAQMVKNAVIVPVGAKGGFVPKLTPMGADRETVLAEGTACYRIFIGALLDLTDNLDADRVLPPQGVVRHDGDDPYLVVAADKGTASFSDTANDIAVSRNYWLGDAFASGGSAGYDHKKMGITARGGWEAVRRHFREMDRDIQTEPFTAVGVGDMSGDVFGNGMLLSEQTRLVAAFDHRDIFIDPDPDPAVSFAERRRLFELPRSSWQDYNQDLLSRGGGIYSRNAKTIALSTEARAMLGITANATTPQDVMNAILRAEVDLLWFGGIGTYVRGSGESDTEVGDRANDAIRIRGQDVRASVVGEGANLGVTQKGRVEYALGGGRINSDAIDNSAGVNSSDLEVNIKIALSTLVRSGQMTIEARNAYLVKMTDEVAGLCLRNNYLQTLTLSLAEREGTAGLPDHIDLINALESTGQLNRALEDLPDDTTLGERSAAGQALTRPELAVLLAYAKNTLYASLASSVVPDDPYLSKELFHYFPERLKQDHPETIETHRLRREVIATVLANAMINRGGPAFVHKMTAATSADAAQVACAYATARDAFGLQELNALIDRLDNRMSGATQLALYAEVQSLLVGQTLWFLRNVIFEDGISPVVERYARGVNQVRAALPSLLPQGLSASIAERAAEYEKGGASPEMARRIAELSALALASDIVLVSEKTGQPVNDAARAYFLVLETFSLDRLTHLGGRLALSDRFDRMALDRALANLARAQREITCDVLASGEDQAAGRLARWRDARAAEIDRNVRMVRDLTEGDLTVSRLTVAAGLLSDLVRT